jgi:hypothetical protein
MTDGVRLDPQVTAAGAADLSSAGQALINLLGTTGAQLAADTQARPWGSDEIGQGFDRGYRPGEQQFFAALGALGDYVRKLGEEVTAVVAASLETDRTSSVRVERAYRDQA